MRCVGAPLLLALALVLTACAGASARLSSSGSAESAWQARQTALMAVSVWTLAGRLTAHNNGADIGSAGSAVNVSAALHWVQQASGYSIDVIAPFGQGALRLEGNNDGVMLRLADGRQISAANPDTLLHDHTGLHLPVTSLRFWVMGLPDPASEVRKMLDDAGRLRWLEQAGWRIEFLRYGQINGLDLPDKLVVTHPSLHLRLVIDRWEL